MPVDLRTWRLHSEHSRIMGRLHREFLNQHPDIDDEPDLWSPEVTAMHDAYMAEEVKRFNAARDALAAEIAAEHNGVGTAPLDS